MCAYRHIKETIGTKKVNEKARQRNETDEDRKKEDKLHQHQPIWFQPADWGVYACICTRLDVSETLRLRFVLCYLRICSRQHTTAYDDEESGGHYACGLFGSVYACDSYIYNATNPQSRSSWATKLLIKMWMIGDDAAVVDSVASAVAAAVNNGSPTWTSHSMMSDLSDYMVQPQKPQIKYSHNISSSIETSSIGHKSRYFWRKTKVIRTSNKWRKKKQQTSNENEINRRLVEWKKQLVNAITIGIKWTGKHTSFN